MTHVLVQDPALALQDVSVQVISNRVDLLMQLKVRVVARAKMQEVFLSPPPSTTCPRHTKHHRWSSSPPPLLAPAGSCCILVCLTLVVVLRRLQRPMSHPAKDWQ